MIIEKRAPLYKDVEVVPATDGVRNPVYVLPPLDANGERGWACSAACGGCRDIGRVVMPPSVVNVPQWLAPPAPAQYARRKVGYVTARVETRAVPPRTKVETLAANAVSVQMREEEAGEVEMSPADRAELRGAYKHAYTAAFAEALHRIRRGCDAEVRESMR